jgi:hypothetical protein
MARKYPLSHRRGIEDKLPELSRAEYLLPKHSFPSQLFYLASFLTSSALSHYLVFIYSLGTVLLVQERRSPELKFRPLNLLLCSQSTPR